MLLSDVTDKSENVYFKFQVRGLHDLAAGAVRGPEGGGDLPADQELRQQGHQLHARHPRLQDEVRRPREVPVRPPQEIW